ncbi:MAG: DUF6734 family protein [Runella sp.]
MNSCTYNSSSPTWRDFEFFCHSFWPSSDLKNGWLSVRYHLMGWALSMYSVQKQHGAISLYTNTQGAELLLHHLQLPYDSYELVFDEYQSEFEQFFVVRKLRAYTTSRQPFVHIDGDAFLFEPLPAWFLESPLIAQNLEYNLPCYDEVYQYFRLQSAALPHWLRPHVQGYLPAANMGIVGGRDWAFYDTLEQEVLAFLEQNRPILASMPSDIDVCPFLEQAFFGSLARHQQKPVGYLLEQEITQSQPYHLDRWQDIPRQCGYLHLMNYKRNPTACEMMAQRLYIEAPHLYERCLQVARQLEATRHPIALPPRLYYEGFYRSALLPLDTPAAVREDLALYEQEKQYWIDNLPPLPKLWEHWRGLSQQVNALLMLPEQEMRQQVIGQGRYCKRLVSEWNWVEANEFVGQTDYAANATAPSGYYEVILYLYLHEGVVKEQKLDIVGILLLDTFEEAQPIEAGIEAVWQQIIPHQPTAQETSFKGYLLSRLRFYLYQGVLEIKCKEEHRF